MTVVYLDSVVVLNGLMDYLLLLSTARLAGVPIRRRRYVLGAVIGGLYAGGVFLPGLGFLGAWPVKAAAGVVMALAAFGGEARLGRLTALFFAVSCGLAGIVLALGLVTGSPVPSARGVFYTDVNAGVLLTGATAAELLVSAVFRGSARHAAGGTLAPVRLTVGERTVAFTALLDTGNALRDPVTGEPVLVVAPGTLDSVLPPGVRMLLTPENLAAPAAVLEAVCRAAPELKCRLLPYRAVGTAGGLLLAVRCRQIEVGGERLTGALAALSPTELGTGHAALWGGEVKRRSHHEQVLGGAGAVAAPPVSGGDGPLHRGQRHPAPAPEPGGGDGAVGAPGPGARPAETHRA